MSGLRTVSPGIWVGPTASIGTTHDFDLVIDCVGPLVEAPFAVEVPPSGRTAHTWTIADLDRVVDLTAPLVQAGGRVALCCRHGRSRSVTWLEA